MSSNGIKEDEIFEFPNNIEGLGINGVQSISGTLLVTVDGSLSLGITNGKYCLRKDIDDKDVTLSDNVTNCTNPEILYKNEILNGADPVLKTGMLPVTIDYDGTVRKADKSMEWYRYENKEWVNAILVSENSREKYEKMETGKVINEGDILSYFVWIPRYKYKLWYVDNMETNQISPHSIEIVFEDKDTPKSEGTANGEYLTHPAFTFGEELNGMWVGKFETGYNGSQEEANTKKRILIHQR